MTAVIARPSAIRVKRPTDPAIQPTLGAPNTGGRRMQALGKASPALLRDWHHAWRTISGTSSSARCRLERSHVMDSRAVPKGSQATSFSRYWVSCS